MDVTYSADAWYDGKLTYQGLPINSVTVKADESNQIERTVSLQLSTDEKVLFPSKPDDILGMAGQEINVKAKLGLPTKNYEFSLGWFCKTKVEPTDQFTQYQAGNSRVWFQRGSSIAVTGPDRAQKLLDARFATASQPPAGTTVFDEVTRLCQGIIPVGQHKITDQSLSASVVYETNERLDALDMVAKSAGAKAVVDESGFLILVDRVNSGDVWEIPDGPTGIVATVSRSLDPDGFYNAVVSTGTDPTTGAEIVGFAQEKTGVYRYGGPCGQVPYFHASPLITTQAQADADAQTTLNNLIAQRTATVALTVPTNPALQPGDTARWAAPFGSVDGRVTQITWTSGSSMSIAIQVPLSVVWSIS